MNSFEFISKLFSDGHSYIQINTTPRALPSIITIGTLWKKLGYSKVIKDIFEFRPTFSRYHMIWDVRKVIIDFEKLPKRSDLTLKYSLSCLILGGQRMQTRQSKP